MTREELQALMVEAQAIQADIARFLTKGQDILRHWDDFTSEARTRIGAANRLMSLTPSRLSVTDVKGRWSEK